MKSKHATIEVTTAWTELEEAFDITSWAVYATAAVYVQEYGTTGWGASISVPAETSYYYPTSVKKIRVAVVTGTASVNYSLLGIRISTVSYLDFDLAASIEMLEGRLSWNPDDGTLNMGMPGGVVNLQIGQEQLIRAKANGAILNGQLVYISGASGQKPIVSLAQAISEAMSECTIAMATEDIGNNQFGYVTTFGLVRGVNTAAFTAGDILYLSAATPGGFTNVAPTSPNYTVKVGYCLYSHASEGIVFICVHADIWRTVLIQEYVPYTGANADVDLGTQNLQTLGSIEAGNAAFGEDAKLNIDDTGDAYFSGAGAGLPFGSLYGDNFNQTVTVLATDTYYEVGGGLSGGDENLMTFQNAKEIKVLKAGKYLVNYSMAVKTASAGQEIEGEVMINGAPQDNTSNHAETMSANKAMGLGGTGILTLALNDVVSLSVSNHTATTDIVVEHANMTLLMIGS